MLVHAYTKHFSARNGSARVDRMPAKALGTSLSAEEHALEHRVAYLGQEVCTEAVERDYR